MERDRALAGLQRQTEQKERQQMGYEEIEFCVLFHCSLWCGDILGGSGRDGGAFLFRFVLYTGFIFPFTFSKPRALFLCPCLQPLSPPFLHPPPFVSCLFDGKLKRSSLPLTICVNDYDIKKHELDVFYHLSKLKKRSMLWRIEMQTLSIESYILINVKLIIT